MPNKTRKCPNCGADSGTTEKEKFTEWYVCHKILTCRGEKTTKDRFNQGLLAITKWVRNRVAGEHDQKTTLTILKRKVAELRDDISTNAGE